MLQGRLVTALSDEPTVRVNKQSNSRNFLWQKCIAEVIVACATLVC